jgi:ribonuclease HII
MRECDRKYPGYGLAHNMGYASDDHRQALRRMGPSEIHRRSFQALCYRGEAAVELVAAEA